ncbi:DUF1444 family protein [Collimonas sp. H4R21]|uniref:DUF1444 family protein n=1 Tax=Collimonas rhizosphaerae TaxID=3126357 RepID=A0ABU9PTM3_9BURK
MFGFLKGRKGKSVPITDRENRVAGETPKVLDQSLLVPIIKVAEFDTYSSPVVALSHDDSPVIKPFSADLIVMYALDLPTHFQFVTFRDLKNSSLTSEELHSIALRNLPNRVPKIELHGQAPQYMVIAGGNFEATLLLFDSMWDQFEQEMPGELLAVVPARDLLFVSASGWEGAKTFLREASSRVLPEDRYALSKCIFVRRNGQWMPYTTD